MCENKVYICNWGILFVIFFTLKSTEAFFVENYFFPYLNSLLWGHLVQISPFLDISQRYYMLFVTFHKAKSENLHLIFLFYMF